MSSQASIWSWACPKAAKAQDHDAVKRERRLVPANLMGMKMVHHAKTNQHRPSAGEPSRRDRHRVPDFKPVALPAVKAAMQAVQKQPRRPVEHELPPILRKDDEQS